MSDYPIRPEKVQPPPLQDDILARGRLLDWLSLKVHHRVVLLTAEAGYGKTTLLADFARRTRMTVFWYRLDRGDRDSVGFLAHLVGSVRRAYPSFGARTSSLLRETGAAPAPLESVLETFLQELNALAPDAAAIVFDDFHLVDDSQEVRGVLRVLLERAPERWTIIVASRRTPPIRLARLRSLGEVAELGSNELRFDPDETGRLFRDLYSIPLEPPLVSQLSRRTEGWAASLNLVRAALADRSESQIRAFIRSLSGAEGHLYDYLAEEVVGDLPERLQAFLMQTSLLERVDLVLGPVAAQVSVDEARGLIEEAEVVGLLSRQGGPVPVARAHPLVRDFLRARLAHSTSTGELEILHLRIAHAARNLDWHAAVQHYVAGGHANEARLVLTDSIETILAEGAYTAAEDAAALLTGDQTTAAIEIVRSRVALRSGETNSAVRHARRAAELDPHSDLAVWNAAMVMLSSGALDEMADYAQRLLAMPTASFRRLSAAAILAGVDSSVSGDLAAAESLFLDAADHASRAGHRHFEGVALVNAALIRRARGDPEVALGYTDQAIDALSATSSGIELVSAHVLRGWALAHLGRMEESRHEIELATSSSAWKLEFASESAEIEAFYGDVRRADALLRPFADEIDRETDIGEQALITSATVDLVQGRVSSASESAAQLALGRKSSSPAVEARRLVIRGLCALLSGDENASADLEHAAQVAATQGARLWSQLASTARASLDAGHSISSPVGGSVYLSMAAEALVLRLPSDGPELDEISAEASQRPERWRPALRQSVRAGGANADRAAALLESIGEVEDVALLRGFARTRSGRASAVGRSLARRLAPRISVQDLGNVEFLVGNRRVQGTEIRRKVLALLCFLISRQAFRAQREEALEALWPDVNPQAALNSLNQTVYFLRRVFEPEYVEDLSPGYVGQSTESVWLDPELLSAESRRVRAMIRQSTESLAPEQVVDAVSAYRGQFALDFVYDEWSTRYRESLHAAYLQLVEVSLRASIESGDFAHGITIAQQASELEPESDVIQVALVRLYRMAGAHAAAAEQYGRYVAVMNDLGLDAAPLAELVAHR